MLYDPNVSLTEKNKLEEFLKQKIWEGFSLFQDKKKGFIPEKYHFFHRQVPYVMRYLGQFPSEAQVRDVILQEIRQDQPNDYIKYSKFEPFMLQVLKQRQYQPDDPQTVLAAFKLLDPQNKGFIEIEEMKRQLMTLGQLKITEFNLTKSKVKTSLTLLLIRILMQRLYGFIDKHLQQNVMKGYAKFNHPKK